MTVDVTESPLTWLSAQIPASHFDAVSRKLWKLLVDGDVKDVFTGAVFEQRDLLESKRGVIWRYAYVDSTSQVILLEERTPHGELLKEWFCVPCGHNLTCGVRLPAPLADRTSGLIAEAGSVQTVDPTASWPVLSQLRAVIADAAAEEHLDETPVASLVAERDYLAACLAEANETLRHARFENRSLKNQLGAVDDTALDEIKAYPESLDLVGTWAEQFSDKVILAERAVRGAKKSLYRDPEMVFRCLEHLATRYWEMKTGKISVAAHEAALSTMPGVSLRGSAGATVAGEQGEAYFITHKGRRVFLDLHLAKGGGFDQRYCMRIYFAWLPDEQRVLVGDLPAHLANSLS
jgi:hypothetical protein